MQYGQLCGGLRSVGYNMPCVFDVMPLLDIDSTAEALTVQLQDMGSAALYCPRAAPTCEYCFFALMSNGLGHTTL